MTWATIRQFAWTTKTSANGVPEVANIALVSDRCQLLVDLSDVILTNAFATTVDRPTLYDATLHELRLLGSYLHQEPDGQIQLQEVALRASARHIRSFVSESVGLGMLTAAVQAAYRSYARGRVHNFDALPTSLVGAYARQGVRPDLLFDLSPTVLAGEARGRSRRPPANCLGEHRKRLNRLLPWAAHHQHDLVMTWTYLSGDGITVDWFMPSTGLPGLVGHVGEPMPPGEPGRREPSTGVGRWEPSYWTTARARDDGAQRYAESADGVPVQDPDDQYGNDAGEPSAEYARGFDQTPPSDVRALAQRRTAEIEQALFDTGPQATAPVRVAGRSVRGAWVPLDLVGPPTGSLLLGVLDEPLSPADGWEVTETLRRRIYRRTNMSRGQEQARDSLANAPLSATVRGRLLIAVANERLGQPWEWIGDELD
jgi:hypothetical protein